MGWFLTRSENKPILPALDNASEGIKRFLAAMVKTKAVFVLTVVVYSFSYFSSNAFLLVFGSSHAPLLE